MELPPPQYPGPGSLLLDKAREQEAQVKDITETLLRTKRPVAAAQLGGIGISSTPEQAECPSQEEIIAYAQYLGMDVEADSDLLYIAEWALTAPVPEGWTVHLDKQGREYFYHTGTKKSQYEHPMDQHYQEHYITAKADRSKQ